MSAADPPLHCGAASCRLDHGARVTDAGMDFIRCPTCRVLRIVPENLIHATVLPDPVGKLSLVMKLLMSMRMRWLVRELPRLAERHVGVADIGCGDGQFLEFLKDRGYDRIAGIEPDALRARNARKRGVPVFTSREEAEFAGLLKEPVEVLFVWHVLEHIEQPADFVDEYSRWMAPSGVMVISVPNSAKRADASVRLFFRVSRLRASSLVSQRRLSGLVRSERFGPRCKNPARPQLRVRDFFLGRLNRIGNNSEAKLRSQGAEEGRGWPDAAACCGIDGAMLIAAGAAACPLEHTCGPRKHADLRVATRQKAVGKHGTGAGG